MLRMRTRFCQRFDAALLHPAAPRCRLSLLAPLRLTLLGSPACVVQATAAA